MTAVHHPEPLGSQRRRAILETAAGIFIRYGYRKTSMEEVARAAGLSRQGLYMHFPSKQSLFRAAVLLSLETSLANAFRALEDPALLLREKIVRVFDEWEVRHIGIAGANRWELIAAAHLHVGEDLIGAHEGRLNDALSRVLSASGLALSAGCTADDTAAVLRTVSRGLASSCPTREDFLSRLQTAVRVILPGACA